MEIIHINCHFAIGIIIASFTHYFLRITLFEFGLIVIFSFIMDFDVLFSKRAKDHNHRMLITHSIIPGIIISIIGVLFNWQIIFICGIAYFIHILIDTFDWGTNFFGFHEKPFGPKFLITKEELKNLNEILANYKVKKSFFDFRYYQNRVIISLEIILTVLMILVNVVLAFEYIFIILIYVPFFFFHMIVYFHLKKIESK